MTTASQRKPLDSQNLEALYLSSLREYVNDRSEDARGRAYELGRRALAKQMSLVELVSVHHQALKALNAAGKGEARQTSLLKASSDFLVECLSPYEMAHRGFRDSITAWQQLNETLEEEIKRIAHSVHDEAGQLLVAVHLALADLARKLPEPQKKQIGQIEELLIQVEEHLRRYSHELRPTILDELGWLPAIKFLATGVSKRANLAIHVSSTLDDRLANPAETALYRVAQEALTNVVKHANARNVWIRAWSEDLLVHCSIRDDGCGFDVQQLQAVSGRNGLGLIAMRERVSAVGGTLRIESHSGQGTELLIQISPEAGHADSHRAR